MASYLPSLLNHALMISDCSYNAVTRELCTPHYHAECGPVLREIGVRYLPREAKKGSSEVGAVLRLPNGWTFSRWLDGPLFLHDTRLRPRAAAPIPRVARFALLPRFSIAVLRRKTAQQPFVRAALEELAHQVAVEVVLDAGIPIVQAPHTPGSTSAARRWLLTHFPRYADPRAYW